VPGAYAPGPLRPRNGKSREISQGASTEKESDAPDQSALMHRENDMLFEIPILDRLQRPLSRDEVHKGLTRSSAETVLAR
jgi:hypothetical protein